MSAREEILKAADNLFGKVGFDAATTREIAELSGKVSDTAGKTRLLFAFFNNHWQAYAPRNAVDMMKALQLPLMDLSVNRELVEDNQQRLK